MLDGVAAACDNAAGIGMSAIELNDLDWQWQGWRPYSWRLRASMETGQGIGFDVGPVDAVVPGTVQEALRRAGRIEDWLVGLNSLACEWVEHRHWELVCRLTAPHDEPIVLAAEGLDYAGWVLVDGREVASWSGALTPQRFDLTEQLGDGAEHWLSIVFDTPPEEQGQIGYTSRSRYFKPRYNFSWDWCARFVPIGVVGGLRLLTGAAAELHLGPVRTELADDLATGTVHLRLEHRPAADRRLRRVSAALYDGDSLLQMLVLPIGEGVNEVRLEPGAVTPWQPNLAGAQKLYRLDVDVIDESDQVLWSATRRVGFKRVRWLPCDGAPADALPWICEVNGTPTFLQGANWSPVRVAYPDTTAADYRQRVALYRDMGCNVLRVWGGAYLPPESFYDACDEAGILVWQEFPLSSSGIDNWPPEQPAAIAELERIAGSYITRRAHHASLLMWCGGNELQSSGPGSKTGGGVPCDLSHPCLAALAAVVERDDPGRRFLPTSAYGPRFSASLETVGSGLHHCVHGPWGIGGAADLEGWFELFRRDDSLFRSETGMPGACDAEVIRRYLPRGWWPPDGPEWRHSSAWWLMLHRFAHLAGLEPEAALAAYIEQTQREQAVALAFAAARHKERFPACGGFIIWHGHDCFPCPIGNALIDVEGRPKPVCEALRQVFYTAAGQTAE